MAQSIFMFWITTSSGRKSIPGNLELTWQVVICSALTFFHSGSISVGTQNSFTYYSRV